jgi:hypothetical protein
MLNMHESETISAGLRCTVLHFSEKAKGNLGFAELSSSEREREKVHAS